MASSSASLSGTCAPSRVADARQNDTTIRQVHHRLNGHLPKAGEHRLSRGLSKLQKGMSSDELHSLGRVRRLGTSDLSVSEGRDRFLFVVQHLEDRYQLGDLQDVLDLGRQVQ